MTSFLRIPVWLCIPSLMFASFDSNAELINTRPNVLFILMDDLGWSDTGYNGSTFYQTPAIDTLAREGMVFTNAYAPACYCVPSRASIMSGQYAARCFWSRISDPNPRTAAPHQEILNGKPRYPPHKTLPLEHHTLAECFKDNGYATGHFGKWHLGGDGFLPTDQGFDVNYSGGTTGGPGSYHYPFGKPDVPGKEGDYLTDRVADEAIQFISDNRNKSFYAQVWFYTPHMPYHAKEALVDLFRGKARPDDIHRNPAYAALIKSGDENIKRILDTLKKLGLEENTMVVFSSDNGGKLDKTEYATSNYPLKGGKGTHWEGGIREPFIVKWPGIVKGGQSCSEPVSLYDLYPTFVDACGLEMNQEQILDGVSILPLLRGDNMPQRPLFWFDSRYQREWHVAVGNIPSAVVRLGKYKLIRDYVAGTMLFDLEDDIGEENDISGGEAAVTKRLNNMLDKWLEEMQVYVPQQNAAYNDRLPKPKEVTDVDPDKYSLFRQWIFDGTSAGWLPGNGVRLVPQEDRLKVSISGTVPSIGIEVPELNNKPFLVEVFYRSFQPGLFRVSYGVQRDGRKQSQTDFHAVRDGEWHTGRVIVLPKGEGSYLSVVLGVNKMNWGHLSSEGRNVKLVYRNPICEFDKAYVEIKHVKVFTLKE